jgi:hypothetical protein
MKMKTYRVQYKGGKAIVQAASATNAAHLVAVEDPKKQIYNTTRIDGRSREAQQAS